MSALLSGRPKHNFILLLHLALLYLAQKQFEFAYDDGNHVIRTAHQHQTEVSCGSDRKSSAHDINFIMHS